MKKIEEWILCSMKNAIENKSFAKNLITLTLVFLELWLMNSYARPYYIDVFPSINEIVHILDTLIYLAIAFIAFFRPHSIKPSFLNALSFGALLLGAAMIAQGIFANNFSFFIAGGLLFSMGRAAASLIASITLSDLSPKQCVICITSALTLLYALSGLFELLPSSFGFIAFVVAPILYLPIAYPSAQKIIAGPKKSQQAIRDLSVTEPQAFIPFSHKFFLAMFVFRAASGFSMTFNSSDGAPAQVMFAFIPLAIALLLMLKSKTTKFADTLYHFSTLFILAGFLLVLPMQTYSIVFPNILLTTGADFFRILAFFALAQISRRNPRGSLLAFSWGFAAMNAGSLLGFILGTHTDQLLLMDPELATLLIAGVIFLFAAFNLVVLHKFSFEETVQNIVMVSLDQDTNIQDETSGSNQFLGTKCEILAARYSLTKREEEILGYLARGRSVPFIQKELVISHNTVRTHVKHIYQKLNVHSQQELISKVEAISVAF